MATQPASLSLEEFHRLYDGAKPAYEYWYGTAIQKAMPTSIHAALQVLLLKMLDLAGWNVFSELRLQIAREAAPVPDIVALQGSPDELYPKSAPELCIEILSPDDSLPKTMQKAAKYIAWGTECVWIIDPKKRIAWMFERGAQDPILVGASGALRIRETVIDLPDLFAQVDQKFNRRVK